MLSGPCWVGFDVPETGTGRHLHGNEHPGDALCLDLCARPATVNQAVDDRMGCHFHPLYRSLALHLFSAFRELDLIFQPGHARSGGH